MSLENTMATFAIIFLVAAVSALIVAAGLRLMNLERGVVGAAMLRPTPFPSIARC